MSEDIKKALEHCVEWNCDNCHNREELGRGEIVCRGRLLPEVLEYVANLEAKLAEKDEEIAYLTKQVNKFNNEAQKYFEDAYCNDFHNQDKISFAVEKLEQVKETAECVLDNALKNSSLNQSYYDRLLDEIGNQINQLKVKAERS